MSHILIWKMSWNCENILWSKKYIAVYKTTLFMLLQIITTGDIIQLFTS